MSPLSPEHYERWHLRDCARCGRRAAKAANWSDGPICRTCLHKAENTHGTCPACGTDRLLPGRSDNGEAICRDCAGITRSFSCSRCGHEGQLYTGRLCTRCTLTDLVHTVFDDGTGSISPALRPLADRLIASPNPKSTWMWLRRPYIRDLLSDLADGTLSLTHEALHPLPNWRTVAHLRDLLMASGALPLVDKQILHHETWLTHCYAELADDPHLRILRAFATWHQLPRMRARAAASPLTPGSRSSAGEQFKAAHGFLAWLDDSAHHLGSCTQGLLDAWHATHPQHQHNTLRVFLRWAISDGRMPKLRIPTPATAKAPPLSQRRRLELLRRALSDERLALPTRVSACLMLLLAQPITRIVRLTLDDLISLDGELHIRLGDPPTPVPEPFAGLLLQLADERPHLNTATNPRARWLFPGRRADQPTNPGTLREHLRLAGFLTGTARPAALRQLGRHRAFVRQGHGVSYEAARVRRVAEEAIRKAMQSNNNPAGLINVALEEMLRAPCELPSYTTLDAMAAAVHAEVNAGFFQAVTGRLDAAARARLARLLVVAPVSRRSEFDWLKDVAKAAWWPTPGWELRALGSLALAVRSSIPMPESTPMKLQLCLLTT